MDLGNVVAGELAGRAGRARRRVRDELRLEHRARRRIAVRRDPGRRAARLAPLPRRAAVPVATDRRAIGQLRQLLARPEERRHRLGHMVVGPARQVAKRHLRQGQRVARRAGAFDLRAVRQARAAPEHRRIRRAGVLDLGHRRSVARPTVRAGGRGRPGSDRRTGRRQLPARRFRCATGRPGDAGQHSARGEQDRKARHTRGGQHGQSGNARAEMQIHRQRTAKSIA